MKKDSKAKIASVYSLALYEAAEDRKVVSKVHSDILALLDVLKADADFQKYFSNPLWSVDAKKSALKEIAGKMKLSDETLQCLDVIADNRRFNDLAAILEEFKHLYYRKNNIAEVEVSSVKPLSASQQKKLIGVLEKRLDKKVVVDSVVNPEILGGLRVRFGSDMIDDSIQGKLNRLEIMMKGGQ